MKYSIKVNEVRAKEGSNIKGFATVVFGDSFKITNIAILENKDKGELFVSMPRYRSNERDESNGVIYKDVCNPITAEFREELYTNILDAYARIKEPEKEETQKQERTKEMPEFSVTVTPYEREGSNIKGLARIYFENSFIVNNINIVQGKEKIFVSMPFIRQSRWMSRASQSIRMSAIRSQRISGKNSIMRLSRNMRKQRIRATKRRGRVPRNIMAIPIKRRTKRQHPFDNQ